MVGTLKKNIKESGTGVKGSGRITLRMLSMKVESDMLMEDTFLLKLCAENYPPKSDPV